MNKLLSIPLRLLSLVATMNVGSMAFAVAPSPAISISTNLGASIHGYTLEVTDAPAPTGTAWVVNGQIYVLEDKPYTFKLTGTEHDGWYIGMKPTHDDGVALNHDGRNGSRSGAGPNSTFIYIDKTFNTNGTHLIGQVRYHEGPDFSPASMTPVPIEVHIIKVDLTGFSLSPTWARGDGCDVANHRSTSQATIQPAGVSTITYSIQGDAHGATIDASTGVITPDTDESGTITVRAAATVLPTCFDEMDLLIRAIPTGISGTAIDTGDLDYGAIYTHTCSSSGGSLNGVEITEIVTVAQDDFNTGWGGVAEGTINATLNAAGSFNDNIGTPSGFIDANDFLPSPPEAGLPATMDTPQVLEWKCPLDNNEWKPFADVEITVTLSQDGTNLIVTTTDNGVPEEEPYSGPAVP